MSLHKFAEQVAANGRGEDSLLVHMTPDEVQRLQKFAEANGTSLTINPTTGLPEAGMLSDLFKAVAPIALGAFLGPAGLAFGGGMMSAGMAGLTVGGLTTLATGSLSRGLMAGLGAYGGAGLGAGIESAGTSALAADATGVASGQMMSDTLAERGIFPTLEGGAVNPEYVTEANKAVSNAVSQGTNASAAAKMSAGLGSIASDPLSYAKDNWKPIAAAALPVLGAIGTTTPASAPKPTDTGYIRQKVFDPGTQTYRSLAPVKASEWGDRNFSDIYRGYNGGGIVALAGGGVSDADIFKYFQTPNLSDTQIAADMQKYGVSAADIARATGTQNQQADYEKRFVNTLVAPTTDSSEFLKATEAVGLKDQSLANAMKGAGLSQGAQYALTHADSDAGFNNGIIDASTGKPVSLYTNIGYTAGALPGDQGGLEGLYGNINYVSSGLQNLINTGKMSVADAQNAALAELARTGVSVADVKAATGKDFGSLFMPKKEDKKVVTTTTGTGTTTTGTGTGTGTGTDHSGYHWDGTNWVPNVDATQHTTTTVSQPTDLFTAPATALPVGVSGNTGPSQIGGGATVNPNGTITTSPRIPNIPVGGFTGSQNLRDSWTKGGGSLGYAPKAPQTIDEFNQMFNKQTGDSMAAYNYLMGKGAYPTKSGVGEIARPYREATLGYPTSTNKMYTYDKTTGQYVRNPDYVAPGRDSSGNVTYGLSLNDIKKSLTDSPLQGQALYDWAKTNNLSADDIAAATGMKLSEVYAQFRTGAQASAKKAADDKAAADATGNVSSESSSGTGGQAAGGLQGYAMGGYALGGLGSLGGFSDGGRLLKGPGDGVSDSIPATIGAKQQPARLADGEFVVPARIVSELGNGSTEAGARKLYAMMDRVQKARGKTTGKGRVAANTKADQHLPA